MLSKNDIRLLTLPSLTKVANSLGVSWEKLGGRFKREVILGQLDVLFKQPYPQVEKTSKPLDIIFVAYLGCFQGNNIIQTTLGKILKERGHRVRFLLCDIELPICETTEIANHHRRSEIFSLQQRHMEMFFSKTDFEIIKLTDIVSLDEIEDLKNDLSNPRWDTYVQSKLLRYFKVGVLNKEEPLMKELFDRARHAALISAKMGKAVANLKPDRVIMSHGTYTTRGPAKEIINEAGVPLLTISRAKMAESQKFNWKTAGDWWSVDEEWEKVGEKPLNKDQETLIDEYLLSRRNHTRDIIVYNPTKEEDRAKTIKKLGLDTDKKVYTLFTNVLWDAASAQREVAFDNPIEWTIETIKWFKDKPTKQLVIRIHPAENIIGTKQPMLGIIKQHIKEIPSNVIILDADAPVNSWSLLKVTDIGLVHTSTVGMELALEGIPCVCVSKTHYRGKGFTIDIESREEYFKLLEAETLTDFDKKTTEDFAKRYAYLLFLRYQIPMPFFNPISHISIHSFKGLDWNKIVNHPSISLILNGIENQKEFILDEKTVSDLHK